MITETHLHEAPTSQAETKTPLARLLDLTVGWAQYVEETEADFGDRLSSAALYDLYQEAAQIPAGISPAAQEAAVQEFIRARILPLVCGGTAQ